MLYILRLPDLLFHDRLPVQNEILSVDNVVVIEIEFLYCKRSFHEREGVNPLHFIGGNCRIADFHGNGRFMFLAVVCERICGECNDRGDGFFFDCEIPQRSYLLF